MVKTNDRPVPIKVRIMGKTEELDQFTDALIESLESTVGVQVIERSHPQLCRPPEDDQSRVYLTLIRKGEPERPWSRRSQYKAH